MGRNRNPTRRFTITISTLPLGAAYRERTIARPTLVAAERAALRWLREMRLVSLEGQAWQSWSVVMSDRASGARIVLARGNHLGALESRRDHAWRD